VAERRGRRPLAREQRCKGCGKPFLPRGVKYPRKFCSHVCAWRDKDRVARPSRALETRTCPQCREPFVVTKGKRGNRYCGHVCLGLAQRVTRETPCVVCGTTITTPGQKEPRKTCSDRCRQQRRSDIITERHRMSAPATPEYSNRKAGRRDDLGGQYFRSSWEANYARYLNWLVAQGEIKSWRYEARTFWFEQIKRGVRSYKPDFEVVNLDDSMEYHEVKGYDYARGKTARARMAKYYPTVKLVLIDEDVYKAIKKWAKLIPDWE
jgi:predicted nucleic acid-binding Zn ribbon protein